VDTRSRPAEGFTVLEVVIAITVLMVSLLGAALLFENTIVVSGNTRNRVVAANLATEAMEQVRSLAADPAKFTTITQGQTVLAGAAQKVNGLQFTVTQNVQFVGQNSTQSSCDSPGSNTGQIMQVQEQVTWASMAGTQPVQAVTLLSPPVGAYSASSGSIAAKVTNSAGAVSQNIDVQVSGPATQSQQTTSEGCAFFAFLPVGTYTVTVVGGGVGDQEVVAPAQTASVSVGQTASLAFSYDTPGTINVTGWNPAAPPAATNIPISVANSGLQPYAQFSYAAGTTSLTPLYPYASGYTVFAGNCTDNNPLGKDTNRTLFYPTAAPTPLNVPPGGTASTTVSLYTLSLHVQNSTAVAVAAGTNTAAETTTFAAPYTAVCTSGTATGTAPTLGLVTTDASGNSVTSLPLGHWTVTAKCTKPAAACPAANKVGSVNVWVQPGGVYAVNASGTAGAKFAGAVTVVVS
jgi:Tfp pilus assembly protein PilV